MSRNVGKCLEMSRNVQEVSTKSGEQRLAGMKPPPDCWFPLRELSEMYGEEIPADGDELRWAWELYSAVYGLGDAPKRFHAELKRCLEQMGFVSSVYDETVMYLRRNGSKWGGD